MSNQRIHRRLRIEELEPRLAPSAVAATTADLSPGEQNQALQVFNSSPLIFVENQGQASDPGVRYMYQGPGANILFTDSGPVFQMFQREDTGPTPNGPDANAVVHATVFQTTFEGARSVEPVALDPMSSRVNYLVGNQDQWHTDLPTYATIVYNGLFDGIDLYASGSRSALKYEFHVAPGADPNKIVVHYDGIDGLSLDDAGVLHIRTPRGEMLDQAPVIYQDIGGQRVQVAGSYRIIDQSTYGFEITGAYDTTMPLVIDPELLWSTFLGTAEEDVIRGVAVEGNYAYVTGWTYGSGFPTKSAYDTTFNRGGRDAFVAKFDVTQSGANSLIYSTYLGGSDDDAGQAIAVLNGYAFVAGGTRSTNFPTAGTYAYQTSYQGGEDYGDAFAVRLGTAGNSLIFSTYLGGTAGDWGQGVSADLSGSENSPYPTGRYRMYVGGFTYSADFPTQQGLGGIPGPGEPNPHQSVLGGLSDGFLSALDTDGTAGSGNSSLFYSSYYGGSLEDYVLAISLGNDQWHDDVELTGFTYSPDLPMDTAHGGLRPGNGWDQTYNGGADAFDTRMCTNLGRLEGATYIGGSGDDYGYGVINRSVRPPDNTYEYGFVVGRTYSTDFPTTANALDRTYNGGDGDAFLTIAANAGYDLDLKTLYYSTYIGGSGQDVAYAVAVGVAPTAPPQNITGIYVTGRTESSDFPTTTGAYDTTYNGAGDAFVMKFNTSGSGLGSLTYSTYLGGSDDDRGAAIAVDTAGNAIVAGETKSSNFPTTSGYGTSYSGDFDGFLTELNTSGTGLLYSTYLASGQTTAGDSVGGIAIDSARNIYVTGTTYSSNFPTTSGAYDVAYNANADVYVAELKADGSGLVYATFLGGSGNDFGYDIALDSTNRIYVTGQTFSSNFPTQSAYQGTLNGTSDAFVTRFAAGGASLSYSTYLGGSAADAAYGIAVDSSSRAYVTGETASSNFPITGGTVQASFGGGTGDAFVARFGGSSGVLRYSTFLGGSLEDRGNEIALDSSSNVYVTGLTYSSNYPTTTGAYDTSANGGSDVFVTKLNATLSARTYSTYLGGSADDVGRDLVVDAVGAAYVTGYTYSANFPTTPGAYDTLYDGGINGNAFVTKLGTAGNALTYSTFLGGSSGIVANAIAVDAVGNAYVAGFTYPASGGTAGTAQSDVFVGKLSADGSTLGYSVYLGGSAGDYAYGIAVDPTGCVYVAGITESANFPIANGMFETIQHPGKYPFVLKLSADGVPTWSTYLGGQSNDAAYGIALDSNRNVYVTGYTYSYDFPTVPGSYDRLRGGTIDAFVSKFTPDGVFLLYSTFLGGTAGADYGYGIVVDNNGYAYVTGRTESSDFPTLNAYDSSYNGSGDAFVTKLSTAGNALVYSTFLGGTGSDTGYAIARDASGNAYVTGVTASTNFPTQSPYQASNAGSNDGFVTKLSAAGNTLVYSTYLGGSLADTAYGIAVDTSGNAYVTGATASNPFPTLNAYDSSYNGSGDAFVTKLGTAGTALVYSTYLGGSSADTGYGIAVDAGGNAYVTGATASSGFPTLNAYQPIYGTNTDAFVTKFNVTGSTVGYSTFLGGSSADTGYAIAVDASGYAYVTGATASTNFPTTTTAYQTSNAGSSDAFVTKLGTAGNALAYSTYLGGSGADTGGAIVADTAGNAYVAGYTLSSNFPTTAAGYDRYFGGSGATGDGFVTMIDPLPSVAETAPVNGSIIRALPSYEVSLSEAVDPATVQASDLVLAGPGVGTLAVGGVALVDDRTLKFSLTGAPGCGALSLILPAGAVSDTSGEPFPADERRFVVPIALQPGRPYVFRDEDGSVVTIALYGPGTGYVALANGETTGAAIASIVLNDTTAATSLAIVSRGGTEPGTALQEVRIVGAGGSAGALRNLGTRGINLAAGGQIIVDGSVRSIVLGNVGPGAEVSIAGTLKSFRAGTVGDQFALLVDGDLGVFKAAAEDFSIRATGTLGSLQVTGTRPGLNTLSGSLDVGALISLVARGVVLQDFTVRALDSIGMLRAKGMNNTTLSAGTIGRVAVSGDMVGSRILAGYDIGAGGILGAAGAFAGAKGNIGYVTVDGSMRSSSIAAGIDPGTDGLFGSTDDRVLVSSSLEGAISSVTVKGTLAGSDNPAESFGIAAHSQIGQVKVGKRLLSSPWQSGNIRVVGNVEAIGGP